MRKGDDAVFFFTIVDLLVTAIFLGLVLSVIKKADAKTELQEAKREAVRLEELAKRTGASGVTELTDRLTRLGPVGEIERKMRLLDSAGGVEEVARDRAVLNQAGGRDSIGAALSRLKRFEEGVGLPPCLYTVRNGKRVITTLAAVTAMDSTIRFNGLTPALDTVLKQLGQPYRAVENLTLNQFRQAFRPLRQLRPNCLYSVHIVERTPYVYARDAVQSAFRSSGIVRFPR